MSVAWGVDVSTRRVAAASIDAAGAARWTHTNIPDDRGAQRLASIARSTRALALEFADPWASRAPTLIFVEDANVGPSSNKPLVQAVGVVMASLQAACRCVVMEVPIGSWKKESLGNGAAKKDQVMEFARGELGYTGCVQDEADALCLALAASRRLPA